MQLKINLRASCLPSRIHIFNFASLVCRRRRHELLLAVVVVVGGGGGVTKETLNNIFHLLERESHRKREVAETSKGP